MRKTFLYLLFSFLFILFWIVSAFQNPSPGTEVEFEKQVLTSEFISEGVAVGDVNGDGLMDVMAGAYWFEAPDWTPHEITTPQKFEPDKGYSNSFLNFSMDVDQDGLIDLIRVGWPGNEVVWYKNPGKKGGHWEEFLIHDHQGNESPAFADINGDGRKDLICNDPKRKQIIWLEAPSEKGDTKWKKHVISGKEGIPGTHQYTHGLGVADVNRDGRPDVMITKGWWEAPEDPAEEEWTFHPVDWGEDCSQMYLYDVNGDGNADLISSSAHNYGIWWHEQKIQPDGSVQWIRHLIDRSFSQSHSLMMADINGDGHLDLVTGKRYYAHNGGDPGAEEPSVLNWYEYVPGISPSWIRHEIDDDSGSGLNLVVEDMNGNGKPDVVIANKKGVFVFLQK